MHVHAYNYFSNVLMIYLHTAICFYFIGIHEIEPSVAQSSNENLGPTTLPSDEQPPHAKKITGAFDIRYPNLPPAVVEVRPRVQVALPSTYQVHPRLQTCRDILRVMSIQTKSKNEDRENKKRKAEKFVAEKKTSLRRKDVVQKEKNT